MYTTTRRSRNLDRRKKRAALEGFNLLIFLMGSIFFMEIILRVNTETSFFNIGLIFSALFAASTALCIYLLTSFFRGWGRTLILGLTLGVTTILFASQFIYYKIFKTFYTVFSAQNGGQVLEFMNDILFMIRKNFLWLLLLFLPLVLFLVLKARSRKSTYRFTWTERGISLALFVLFFGAALMGINLGDKEQNSAFDMYYKNNYPVASVNQLGLLTSMRLDLQRTLTGFDPVVEAPPVVEVPQTPGETPSETPVESPTEEPPKVYAPNVMTIDFDQLLSQAGTDAELAKMHTYFKNREATLQNDFTGKYKGYNLILITAEGYSHYAVNKDVTPTLYKMTHEGVNFTNFYNPIWGVSTSDGEYVATTGLIPKSGVWSMYKSGSNAMPFAMGNQLRHIGYKTLAYHNHTYNYYNRDVSHPNLGYDYKGLGNGLQVRKTWPESDLEMMEVTTEEFVHDEPFHAYFMTVSGHMRYTWGGNFIASKNKALVQNLPYSEGAKAYLATQIELDRALEYLLQKLDEAGVAENTLIAMSADHYPYGLDKADIDNLAGHEVESNFELYKSSFILYAKGMEPMTIDRPVSSLDIIPTISNLLGLEYDSRLLMGVDMFSTKAPLIIFNNRSFITDLGKYNSVTKQFTLNPGATLPAGYATADDYRKAISAEIDRQFYFSTKILEKNYYAKVVNR